MVFDELEGHPYSNKFLEVEMIGFKAFNVSFFNQDDTSTVLCNFVVDMNEDNMRMNSYAENLFPMDY